MDKLGECLKEECDEYFSNIKDHILQVGKKLLHPHICVKRGKKRGRESVVALARQTSLDLSVHEYRWECMGMVV